LNKKFTYLLTLLNPRQTTLPKGVRTQKNQLQLGTTVLNSHIAFFTKQTSSLAAHPRKDYFQTMCHGSKCQHNQAQTYLSDQLQQVSQLASRVKTAFRSSTSSLVVPVTRRSTLGDRAFPVSAARAWNSLPSIVIAAPTLSSFHRALKTHLFTVSFPS